VLDQSSPTSEGAEFYKGNALSGAVKTSNNEVLIREEDFLGEAYVVGGEALLEKFAYPRLPENLSEIEYLKDNPEILEQFNQFGCTTALPKGFS
jgi:hypothetical protein